MRLYLDTSILGAVLDHEDPRRVAASRELLLAISAGKHAGLLSNVVQEELADASDRVREAILAEMRNAEFELAVEDEESQELFASYDAMAIIPPRYRNDLRHLAVASAARADALVSWNFRHLVNIRTRRAVHAVNVRLGYPLIEIVSPEEVP